MELLHQGKRISKDVVTPTKLGLLVLIKEVCLAKNMLRREAVDSTAASIPWFDNNKQKRSFAIVTLDLIQGPDLEIQQFLSLVRKVLSNSLYDVFIKRLHDTSSSGISGLMDLIQSLEVLLVDPNHPISVVHKSSVIGLFVRHMMLAFDKLSFGQMTKLYHNYQEYCSPILNESSVNDRSGSETISFEDPIPTSKRQAELFVARQATRLQINEKAALSPPELQKQLRYLLTAHPNLAEAHFLTLMNCLRVQEYCGSVHSVHRTFDCATVEDIVGEETSRNFRFAALNLGSLLCRFGFKDEAKLALNEAMIMAREANDNVCLQHALVWLYRLDNERKDVLIERSIMKTGELSLPYLASVGILTFSQLKASTPALPAQVFEFIRKCDILNCQHSMLELTTQSYAQKASVWKLYGKMRMVLLTTQLLLYLNTSEPSGRWLCHSGEALCRAFCHLAMLLSTEGKYERATEVLALAKEEFPIHTTYSNVWMFTERLLAYEQALWRGHWHDAELAVANLAVFDSFESKIRKAELLMYKGELVSSCNILDELLADPNITDPENKIRCLMLIGQCHCHAREPAMAMLPLSKTLSMARKHHLKHYQAVVTMHLANVQYLMDFPNRALHLIDSIKIHFLVHGSLIELGKLKLLHAKCMVKKAVDMLSENSQQHAALLATAAFELGKAVDDFLKVEAFFLGKDAAYRQARLFDELGMKEQRNRAAFQFRQLDQLCGSTTLTTHELL